MQPRGQLWFELQRVCQDFRDFSGLEPKEAGQILVVVLRNLLAEQEDHLAKLTPPAAGAAGGGKETLPEGQGGPDRGDRPPAGSGGESVP